MFKIDWPTAIGGVVLGYYAKGKVEDTKAHFKGIYTGALKNLKEVFERDDSQGPQGPQAPQGPQGQGQNGN